MQELTAREANRLRAEPDTLFVDVREPWEHARCHIEGALHIPLDEIPQRLAELARTAAIVVVCHHGVRSRQVMHYLLRAGYPRVYNLAGGIDAWAREIAPGMARY